jgi:hypothetical protein
MPTTPYQSHASTAHARPASIPVAMPVLAALALILVTSPAPAQLTLRSQTIEPGAVMSGGTLTLRAVIAQPDATRPRRLVGNTLSLTGGFLVPVTCVADFNGNGSRDIDDIFIFLNAWFASDPAADMNATTTLDIDDVFIFLNRWFAGC